MNALLAFALGILAVFVFEWILDLAQALRKRREAARQRIDKLERRVDLHLPDAYGWALKNQVDDLRARLESRGR